MKGKVVVVTGGAGLIGREFVKSIVAQGGIAIIADIDEKYGRKVSKTIRIQSNSKNIIFLKFDTTSKESIDNLIQEVHAKYGRIDALVNNAYPRNKNYGKHFFDVEYEDFVENLGANLGGYFLSSQLFAKYFQKQKLHSGPARSRCHNQRVCAALKHRRLLQIRPGQLIRTAT